LTTTIRYVRYTVGIKILLARHALFSFFISIIPALMPVVGLKVLHLEASNLGYLFTAMAVRSQAISGNGRHDNRGRGEKVSDRKVNEIGVRGLRAVA
jgi:hypothetical protein